jgi:hypothetical protein
VQKLYQGMHTSSAKELISGGQATVCGTKLSYSTLATYDDGDSLMLAYTICSNEIDSTFVQSLDLFHLV